MEGKIPVTAENIVERIFFIRGMKVLCDFDLASLYGVQTRVLKQQVRRNIERFPGDFMFNLTHTEWSELITNCDKLPSKVRHLPGPPLAFTEQGIAMLSSVLRSKQAIRVNIAIMRAFVQLRLLIDTNKEIEKRMDELESKCEEQFRLVFEAIRQLIIQENEPRKQVGYKIPVRHENDKD
jgi:hypothetical protein